MEGDTDKVNGCVLNDILDPVFQFTMDGFWILDFEGNVIEVNEVGCSMLGYSRSEMLAFSLFTVGIAYTHEEIQALIERIILSGEARIEVKLQRKNELILDVELSIKKHPSKKILVVFVRDITDRKKAEDSILLHGSYLSAIIENLPGLLWLKDKDSRFLAVNEKFLKACGVQKLEAIIGKTDRDIWPVELAEKYVNDDLNVINSREPIKAEELIIDNHKETWFETFKTPIISELGNVIGTTGYSFDISERKNAEEEIRQRTAMFEALLNTTIDGILIIDSKGKKVFQNQTMVQLLNIPKEFAENEDDQYQLQYVVSLMKDPDQFTQKVFYLYDHPLETSQDELELTNGKVFERYSAPVLGKNGHNYGRIWLFRDITRRKHAERMLIEAKEKAQESDRLKTAFLQNMSHEIRTPMNAIMGFSELLYKNVDDKVKLKKFTNIISQRCNDLLDIINDILDIAKIESGQVTLNYEQCNLNELFTELYTFFNEYQNRIEKKHIDLQFKMDRELNDSITIDKVKLKQIFINLINNAFKFTEKGKIEYGCKLDKYKNLVFYVSDTGIGIPANMHKAIFERFTQLNHGLKLNTGGTGLGLSIVQGLVNLLGSEVFLESEPGIGSTFSFSISYKTYPQITKKQVIDEEMPIIRNTSKKTVLIVEDEIYNMEYLKELLSNTEFIILDTAFGLEAVKIALSRPVDLVLMDVRLPDISGYEATRLIKQQNPAIKIIAQTAYAASDESQKALEAGCDDYLSKPIKQESLFSIICKFLA
jgi:PAS domain S-box-containing protein